MHSRDKVETVAVHKIKLEGLLKSLGLWEEVQSGSITCGVCNELLSLENIGMIVPSGSEIQLCCKEVRCIQKVTVLSEESSDED